MFTVIIVIGYFLFCIVAYGIYTSRIKKRREKENNLVRDAEELYMNGISAETSKTVKAALDEYETRYHAAASEQKLTHDSLYRSEISELRDEYQSLLTEEWQEKASRILDRFYELYSIITNPMYSDIEKAMKSKDECIRKWQEYFSSIPDEGITCDPRRYMKEYLDLNFDNCMYSHEALEKKLSTRIAEMKPEYRRKMKLRDQILDIVAEHESVMRAKLINMPFEGCTKKEVELCVRELVEQYRLVAMKIGNRYFLSLSDREKSRRS